jgi:anti-sigma-K factor RskA
MTYSRLPENWQELMAGYALGDLSSEEAETVQRLLTENPELTSEVNQFQEVLALMPYALPEPEPPPRLRDAILRQAQANEPREISRRVPWISVGSAIAALVLGAIAVDNYRLRQENQSNQLTISRLQQEAKTTVALAAALRNPNAHLYDLVGTEKAAQASARLVVAPGEQAVIVVNDLPQLPTDHAYRLWAVAKNATTPTYCGEFNSQRTVSTWALPETICSKAVSQMLITTELAADPPIPKGELVMRSKG